ncbi:MAG TPA: hypothetical protein VJS65_09415, partial [Verrucomicrobiae bacterium]|nr:hypothetical protein [Verrucomicrobiae bacterium]
VGGFFGTIAGQSRSRVASFSLPNGALENWNPGVGTVTILSPAVYKIAVQGNTVFVAGAFSTLGTSNRVNIGAVDATTGVTTSWDARADLRLSSGIPTASIQGMALHNNVLYVGGILVNIGGQARTYAAALDPTTGNATPWNPDPNSLALEFSGVGNSIYVGGVFSTLGGLARTNLAAFNVSTRQVTPWNPSTTNNVLALLVSGNSVYVGGEFNRVNGVIRSNLAAVDLTSGALLPWGPNPNLYVIALAQWNDRLFVGGGFTNISGAGRTNIAEFDLSTGALTAWSPVLNRAQVRVLTVSGNTLYAGGLISTVDGINRRRVAAFDLPSGALSSWNPDITSSGGVVEAIVPFGDRVYIGGRFTAVAGQPRTNLFAVDAVTAQLLSWTANADFPVVAIAPNSNLVFVAGDFQNIGGQRRNYLAALDATTGAATPWNPNPDFFLRKLLLADGVLYPGGAFMRIGGQTGRGIAAFSLASVAVPSIDPASLVRLSDGRFQFQFTAPGSGQATVWGSTNLATWQNLQIVPVSNGEAQFIDVDAPAHTRRFYRVSVP